MLNSFNSLLFKNLANLLFFLHKTLLLRIKQSRNYLSWIWIFKIGYCFMHSSKLPSEANIQI